MESPASLLVRWESSFAGSGCGVSASNGINASLPKSKIFYYIICERLLGSYIAQDRLGLALIYVTEIFVK